MRSRGSVRTAGAASPRYAARVVGVCGLALLCGALASARGAALDDAQPSRQRARSASVSSGLPWDGRLSRAVRLRLGEHVVPVADYAGQANFYGAAELVSLIERAAHAIAARWPGSQLAVGELSGPRGGKIDGHHSHQSGRDADIAFLMRDDQGMSSRFRRFVQFGGEGVGLRTRRPLYFDDARNWALVSSMLRDPDARVQYMFVAHPIRTRLLMEGRRQGESEDFLRAAAAVLVQPKERHKHDNHFHVRIYCPRDDRPHCQDIEPYWPWYGEVPPGEKHAELPLIRWRAPSQ